MKSIPGEIPIRLIDVLSGNIVEPACDPEEWTFDEDNLK